MMMQTIRPLRLLVSLFALLLASGILGCATNDPANVLERWLGAARAANLDLLEQLSTGEALAKVREQADGIRHLVMLELSGAGDSTPVASPPADNAAANSDATPAALERQFDFAWTVIGHEARIDGDTAEIPVELVRRGRRVSRTFTLTRDDGGTWRVAQYR